VIYILLLFLMLFYKRSFVSLCLAMIIITLYFIILKRNLTRFFN
jgi:hypothetical protein